MKMVTDPQMSLLIRLKGGQRIKLSEVHTITLASSLRKGMIRPVRKEVKLTRLGDEIYEFNHRRRYLAWKSQLKKARDMKKGARR